MAVEITRRLVDDYDGKSTADGTIDFSFDGTKYLIDLSSDNAKAFRADMERWVSAARKVGKTAATRKPSSKPHSPSVKIDPAQAAVVREWSRGRERGELVELAAQAGLSAPDRGRLSLEIQTAAYNVANPTKRTARETEPANNGMFSNA